jgi:hypothetical protein
MKYILDNSAFGAPSPRRVQTNPSHRGPSSAVVPNYYDTPDWWQLRAAIMKALLDFPEARDSVVRALRDLHALQESDASSS